DQDGAPETGHLRDRFRCGSLQLLHYCLPNVPAVIGRRIVGAPLNEVSGPALRDGYPLVARKEEGLLPDAASDWRIAGRIEQLISKGPAKPADALPKLVKVG